MISQGWMGHWRNWKDAVISLLFSRRVILVISKCGRNCDVLFFQLVFQLAGTVLTALRRIEPVPYWFIYGNVVIIPQKETKSDSVV